MNATGHFSEGDWVLFDENPALGIKRYRLELGNGQAVMRTEYHRTEALFDANNDDAIASNGTRWGDGQIVARIPLNVFWRDLSEAMKNGDDGYIDGYLNDIDHSRFRTRGGKL